jgi:hypothetical protein
MDSQTLTTAQIASTMNSGYWQVDGKCFFEKIDCLQYASSIKNYNVSYHIFDQEYSSLNWGSDEFTFNLDEMYKRRAQQIRDKYEYVMVAFSGGADSRNLLNTFLENDIRVDEIVAYYPVQASDKLLSTFNVVDKSASNAIFEYYTACEPTLKEISAKYPNIKITLIDYTEYTINLVANDKPEELVKYGSTLSVYNAGERMLSNMLKEYSEKYNSACCVYGIDKPNIRFDISKNRFGVCMSDFAHNKCKFIIDGYRPIIEPFYQTPDMPQLLLAQTKVIKQYLMPMLTGESISPAVQAIMSNSRDPNIKMIEPHSDIIKTILYKNYNPKIYQSDKPIMHFAGQEPESWFHKSSLVDSKTVDYFFGQHNDWLYNVDDALIVRDNKGIPIKFKPYSSKIYWC